ncbi:MAG TPA: hypothetical protein VG797_08465, partial [Phycisphaerales bacterium]|nr:hypothetical protein [Phycisphaerales bacterium]
TAPAPEPCGCGGTPTQLPPPPAHSPIDPGAPRVAILDPGAAPDLTPLAPMSHRDSPAGEPRRSDTQTLLRLHCALIS